MIQSTIQRRLLQAAAFAAALSAAGCAYVPFVSHKEDLAPARASAENIIRLDAATRSGCASVDNIERPDPATSRDANADQQIWIAHSCNGDLPYKVYTVPASDPPVLKVEAIEVPIHRAMNQHFRPAAPDAAASSAAPAP
ncbi:MAG: hypothetical protein ACRYG5_04695 [Janthinobacterium lividum]